MGRAQRGDLGRMAPSSPHERDHKVVTTLHQISPIRKPLFSLLVTFYENIDDKDNEQRRINREYMDKGEHTNKEYTDKGYTKLVY